MLQSTPIRPNSQEVTVTTTPETFEVYVASLGGYPTAGDYEKAANKLMETLSFEGKTFVSNIIYTAGYDSPFRVFGRHSEVWVVAEAA